MMSISEVLTAVSMHVCAAGLVVTGVSKKCSALVFTVEAISGGSWEFLIPGMVKGKVYPRTGHEGPEGE